MIRPSGVASAISGYGHVLFVDDNGVLWTWGKCGRTRFVYDAVPTPVLDNVVYAAISPGIHNAHAMYNRRSFAIRADSSLWGFGGNTGADIRGYLGDGTDIHRHEPVHIMDNVKSITPTYTGGLAITNCNTLWGWGNFWRDPWAEYAPILSPVKVMENIASVSECGNFAITTTGQLWDLHLHTHQPYGEPFEITEPELLMENIRYARRTNTGTFVITTDNRLLAWGSNLEHEFDMHWAWSPPLGCGTKTARQTPAEILTNVASFTAAGNTAFAITNDDELWGWGGGRDWFQEDGDGLLGLGDVLFPVLIMENVASIDTDFITDHGWVSAVSTYVITHGSALWAFGGGFGDWVSLGDGTTNYRAHPVLIICGEAECDV